jgi:ATP-dependent Clp endopeptidase proteolytic subunit ClpP
MKSTITVDPLIRWDRKMGLVEEPVIIRVKEFTEESAESFEEDIAKAHNTGQPVVPVLIDSYGGQVYSLLSMVSDIENSDIPIATICVGKAMSCGAILLSCGAKGMRYCDKHANVMIHDVSAMSFGKNEELKAHAKNVDRLNKHVFQMMATNCGQPKNYFLDKMDEKKHAEWYLSALEAKKQGLVNELSIPSMNYKISVDITFE